MQPHARVRFALVLCLFFLLVCSGMSAVRCFPRCVSLLFAAVSAVVPMLACADGEIVSSARTQVEEPAVLEFLMVHPESEALVRLPAVAEAIAAAPAGSCVAGSSVKGADLDGYVIVPQRLLDAEGEVLRREDGEVAVEYWVLESPASAQRRGVYVSEAQVEGVSREFTPPNAVCVRLSAEGSRRLALLTSGLRFGHDRVAVVCGGVVLMAPVVQVPLSLRDVVLTGLSEDEADLLLDVWEGE